MPLLYLIEILPSISVCLCTLVPLGNSISSSELLLHLTEIGCFPSTTKILPGSFGIGLFLEITETWLLNPVVAPQLLTKATARRALSGDSSP